MLPESRTGRTFKMRAQIYEKFRDQKVLGLYTRNRITDYEGWGGVIIYHWKIGALIESYLLSY